MSDSIVRVETVELDRSGSRQIGSRKGILELLADRRRDIEAAIGEASKIVQDAAAGIEEDEGWRVSTVEVTFGVTLTAEAGVVLTKASAEASLEVTLTVERR